MLVRASSHSTDRLASETVLSYIVISRYLATTTEQTDHSVCTVVVMIYMGM
jgi:hypothetical protein